MKFTAIMALCSLVGASAPYGEEKKAPTYWPYTDKTSDTKPWDPVTDGNAVQASGCECNDPKGGSRLCELKTTPNPGWSCLCHTILKEPIDYKVGPEYYCGFKNEYMYPIFNFGTNKRMHEPPKP